MSNRETITNHTEAIWSLACSKSLPSSQLTPGQAEEVDADEVLILSGSLDETVKLWNLDLEYDELKGIEKFNSQLANQHHLAITSVDVNLQGTVAASVSLDNQLAVYSIKENKVMHKINLPKMNGYKVKFNIKGDAVAVAGQYGKIHLYSTEGGELVYSLNTLSEEFVMSLSFSPCGNFLACGTNVGHVYTFHLPTQAISQKFLGHNLPIRTLSYSLDSALLAVGCDDGRITIYDPLYQNVVGSLIGHTSWITHLLFIKDNTGHHQVLVSSSCDTTLKFWNLSTKTCLATSKVNSQDTSATNQIWAFIAVPSQTQNVHKFVLSLESGLIKVLDQPYFNI